MAAADTVAPVLEALAKVGVDVAEAHKAALVQMIEHVADADAKAAMDALADHIVLHGLAGAFQNAARSDVTGSENDIIAILNQNIEGGADAAIAWLKQVASGAPSK